MENEAKNIHTLEKIQSVYVDIDKIKPNPYNPNRQSEREFELLCRSIEEDGFTQPILVQKEDSAVHPGCIVDGEHRWRACSALGWKKIPVVWTDMTEPQMMIATLRHNRARGSENIAMASDVLRELEGLGALDHAADSLMMDDVEMQVMLEDIPQAELVLRNPGDKLTAAEVEDMIQKEKEAKEKKERYDNALAQIENKRITLVLYVHLYEKKQINQALCLVAGREFKPSLESLSSDEVYELCKLYVDDAEAEAAMSKEDDQPLHTKEVLEAING